MFTKVQMNLREETIKKVKWLQDRLGSSSRTDAVVSAIEIARMVVRAIRSGGSVTVREPGKDTYKIILRSPE